MTDVSITANHDVFNQSPAFEDYNLYASDIALRQAIANNGGDSHEQVLQELGSELGSAEALEQGHLANEHLPKLKTHDTKGHRLDKIEFHPAYHACMARSFGHKLHSASWEHLLEGGKRPKGATVARAAGIFMTCQVEAGHVCPVTMTHAVVPALMFTPELADQYLPKILVGDYDQAFVPVPDKRAVIFGMGMTEKQGGTDVRANSSVAKPVRKPGPGAEYILTGHKWFVSAPMCDVFLMLAQAEKGLSCFVVPRFLPDGTMNDIRIQRLKDKLGNRSNASSEIEFNSAHGWLLGEEGRGVRTIIEMTTYTRVDCALGSAGLMRMGLAQALHHVSHRSVFQKKLIDQPMMSRVLADLALESEAATALVMRLARSYDQTDANGAGPEHETAYRRLMTAAAKFWVCKRGVGAVYEAMECLGGNGYVEDGLMARHYREAPLNAIWEGSGNVMCLDVLRVLEKTPGMFETVLSELEGVASSAPALKRAIDWLKQQAGQIVGDERRARGFVEMLARIAAAAELIRNAPNHVSDGFLQIRFGDGCAELFGAFDGEIDERALIKRSMP